VLFKNIYAQDSINNNIKQRDLFLKQKKQFNKIETNKKNTTIYHYDIKKPHLKKPNESQCFKTTQIKENTITLLSKDEKNNTYKKYLNQCNTITDLKNLMKELTARYMQKGYITSKVYLKPQNISKGIVELHAVEGKIEAFLDDSLSTVMAFGKLEGDYLNLRDLEVGIENLNRLSSNQAKLDLQPGSKIGFTKVNVENQTKNRINGMFSFNNYGQEVTGEQQLSGNINFDNPFKLNDKLSININTTDHHNKTENSLGDVYSYSVPFGRTLYSLSYSKSRYKQLIQADFNRFEIKGESHTFNLGVNYKLFHNQNNKLSIKASLEHYRTKKYLEDAQLETSTLNLSKASLGVDYLYQSSSYQALFSFEFSKGIHLFETTNPTLLDERYKTYVWDINFIKFFTPFQYSFDFHLQHTKDALFSNEQISIGGPYSVRGYKEEGLDGNRGFYYRNELTYSLEKKWFNLWQPTFYLGFDGGWIKKEEDTTGGTLLGEFVGFKLDSTDWFMDIYYSKALDTSDVIQTKNFLGFQLVYRF
jgi:hemolysin activation/secretion protein